MKRKFYEKLLKWKKENIETPLMVVGARQIGKTYVIEEFCKKEFEDYIEINLDLEQDIQRAFEETIKPGEIIKKIELKYGKVIVPEKTVIFFDEIQVSERAISSLKYFCESKLPYKIICAGSLLGVKLRRFNSSFPVGKVRIEYMYSMDFEEFLWALDKKMWADEIRKCFEKTEPIFIHDQLLELYRTYLCIGGMPKAVENYVSKKNILLWDKKIVSDIITSYLADMNKYTLNNNESIKIEKVYNSVPVSLSHETNKKKYKYIDIEQGANKRTFESSMDWLVSANMVLKCIAVNDIQIPLKVYEQENYFKLYLNDVGLLTSLLQIDCSDILLNREFRFRGAITENYIAQAFIANDISLYYWTSKNEAEVDFLLYNKDGIIPVEVKAKDNVQSKSLKVYMEKWKPSYAIRISAKNFGYANNIKSIPLYAAFCIEN